MKEYIILCGIISICLIAFTYIFNYKNNKDNKRLKYECGEEEFINRDIYTILYYKIAVSYLVFDIETILLFPSAFLSGAFTYGLYLIVYIFVIILILGILFEYYNNIYT